MEPYLSHRDIRVQQQALSCITKISGENLQDRLLAALKSVHEELKIKLVMQLGQAGDGWESHQSLRRTAAFALDIHGGILC